MFFDERNVQMGKGMKIFEENERIMNKFEFYAIYLQFGLLPDNSPSQKYESCAMIYLLKNRNVIDKINEVGNKNE
jgi:hypothetical protein